MLLLSGIVVGALIQLALCRSADTEFGYREAADEGGFEAAEETPESSSNDDAALESEVANCPADFQKTSHGYCFKVVREKRSWVNAAVRCKSFSEKAHLVILGTAVKQHDLQEIIPHDEAMHHSCHHNDFYGNSFWIGAQRIEPASASNFVWRALKDDGTEDYIRSMKYKNWWPGEPNGGVAESCGAIHSAIKWGYQWNDQSCEVHLCAICEIE